MQQSVAPLTKQPGGGFQPLSMSLKMTIRKVNLVLASLKSLQQNNEKLHLNKDMFL